MPPRKTKAAAAPKAKKAASTRSKKAAGTPEEGSSSTAAGLAPPSSDDAPLPLNPAESIVNTIASAVSSGVEAVVEGVNRAEAALESLVEAEVPSAEPLVGAIVQAEEKLEAAVEGLGEVEVPTLKEVESAVSKGKGKAREVFDDAVEAVSEPSSEAKKAVTMEERQAKMKELRLKMNATTAANRKDLITDHQRQKTSAKELAHLEKKKKLAEQLREKADAEENGEDLERAKNWGYSIEESERWEEKLQKKDEGTNRGYVDSAHTAHTAYNKYTTAGALKPDLQQYNRQKETALGLPEGSLTGSSNSKALARVAPTTADSLYRDANSLAYADHKPSQDAIDNVVSKLNQQMESRQNSSRKRTNEDEGDVTYINDRNKVFNKKITRYYDKYTKEIRASFERGTAL